MNLTELLAEVGDKNLEFQLLANSLHGNQKQAAAFVQVTFVTDAVPLVDLVSNEPSKVGLVVWIPGDKWREITKRERSKSK